MRAVQEKNFYDVVQDFLLLASRTLLSIVADTLVCSQVATDDLQFERIFGTNFLVGEKDALDVGQEGVRRIMKARQYQCRNWLFQRRRRKYNSKHFLLSLLPED